MFERPKSFRMMCSLIVFLVVACVEQTENSGAETSVSMNANETRLFNQLQFFVDAGEIRSEAQRQFFAREAAAAGVISIRPMTEAEKPKRLAGAQTGCGRTARGSILVDAERRKCIFAGNLAHEIAHFLAYRQNCTGHGDRFYRLNYQMAERFEERFKGTKWGRLSPTSSVLNRAREYRNGEAGCPGSVNIRG